MDADEVIRVEDAREGRADVPGYPPDLVLLSSWTRTTV